ncbi:MAG: tetratricopeptide repeat protein [Planctomycetota bacterium]
MRSVLDRAAQNLDGDDATSPLVAARLNGTLSRTYLGLGDYTPAERHTREALEIYRDQLGPNDPSTSQAVNGLALALVKQGRFDEAEPMLTTAIDEHTERFGREHEITAQAIDALGQLCVAMERNRDAIPLIEELLDIRTRTVGPERIETLSAMNILGMLYSNTDRFDDAETIYTQAIAISERAHGDRHPQTTELRASLGWAFYHDATSHQRTDEARFADKLASARAINEHVLEQRHRLLGEEHPSTLAVMNNLGAVYKKLGMYAAADELAEKDIEIAIRTLGETHPDTIVSLANMGNSLRNRERHNEAIAYLERALRGARVAHPDDFPGTAFILGWYGSCLRDVGRFADAEPMLVESRAIIVRAMGESHPIASQMALGLAMLYDSWHADEPDAGHNINAAEGRSRIDAPGHPGE